MAFERQVTSQAVKTPAKGRREALAAYLGSTLEYYDYFIYASASALIFDRVFFSAAGDLSLLISLASFAIAYVARPFGALLWGHFGDKLSRKQVLVATLLLMGASTLAIGLLPSYATIGIAAPILLLVFRVIQGISAAGETAGAVSLVVESSDGKRKSLNSSWIQSGNLSGFILANLVFVPVVMLPDEQLFSWGWRVPFLLSIGLLVLGFVIRRAIPEPEDFVKAKQEGGTPKRSPLIELFRNNKRSVIILAGLGLFQGTHTMVTVTGLAFASQIVGLDNSTVLWILIGVSVVSLGTVGFGGHLSDKFGGKKIFIAGVVGVVPAYALFIWAITTGHYLAIFGAALLVYAVVYSVANGSTMALFAAQIDVRVRYSGLAVGLQLAGLCFGFAPAISMALIGTDMSAWPKLIAVQFVLTLVAAVAWVFAKDSRDKSPLPQDGKEKVLSYEA